MAKLKKLLKERQDRFNKIISDIDLLIEIVEGNNLDFTINKDFKSNKKYEEITAKDFVDIEDDANKKLGRDPQVDLGNTKSHFYDRLNDKRNEDKPITRVELEDIFDKLSKNKGKFLNFLKKYKEFVVHDMESKLNIPFINKSKHLLVRDKYMMDKFQKINTIIAKTIMRGIPFGSDPKNRFIPKPKDKLFMLESIMNRNENKPKNFANKLTKPLKQMKLTKSILHKLIKEEYQKLTEDTLFNTEETSTDDFEKYLEDFLSKYVPYFEIKRNSANPEGLLYLTISFEKEDTWAGGYIKNSNFIRFSITDNGIVKLVDYHLFKKGKPKQPSNTLSGMRIKPQRASSIPEFVVKMRKYLDKLLAYYATPPKSKKSPKDDSKTSKSERPEETPKETPKKSDRRDTPSDGRRGRPEGTEEDKRIFLAKPKSRKIRRLLEKGMSIREIAETVGASTSTVMKVKKLIGMK